MILTPYHTENWFLLHWNVRNSLDLTFGAECHIPGQVRGKRQTMVTTFHSAPFNTHTPRPTTLQGLGTSIEINDM